MIAALGTEFKPNSKMHVARSAISDFSGEKYGHSNVVSVVRDYIKEPFDKYGENDGIKVWVYYSTYTELEPEIVEDWRRILNQHQIGEQEAANAFYRQEQGQDVSKEKEYYKAAVKEFKNKYNEIPVLVSKWRLK